ncbi:hypothetical protein [Barnesiella intestinihominis]|uniref:hypothetical protein n=1 Tax=Barnesiella intestinihominis TaxID=487174 RepID=UPI003AF094FD
MNTDLHTIKGGMFCPQEYDEYIDYPSIEWDKGLQATSKSECPAPSDQIPYFRIGAAIYRQVAGILQDILGDRNYLSNVKIDWEDEDGNSYTFTDSSVWVYRKRVRFPEGSMDVVDDLGSGWWEFHSYTPEGDEKINDFQFSKLKEYICLTE